MLILTTKQLTAVVETERVRERERLPQGQTARSSVWLQTPGMLSLSPVDSLGPIILGCGTVLCMVGSSH